MAANVATIENAPEGIWIIVVRSLEKPKVAIMILEKLDTAPLSIMANRVMKNKGHVCLSSNKSSLTWYHLKCLFSTPVWLVRTCSIAATFSFSVRNHALIGLSGKTKAVIIPTTAVKQPCGLVVSRAIQTSPSEKQQTYHEKEEDLPVCQFSRFNVLETVGEPRAHNLGNTDLHIPQPSPARLLGFRPPHPSNQDEGGRHACFKHTEKSTNDHQGRIVLARSMARNENAPAGNIDSEIFADGQALHEISSDGFGHNITNVEDCPQVIVLVTLEIRLDAHDGGIVKQGLVEILQEIDCHKDGHDTEIDLPAQLPGVGDIKDNPRFLLADQEFQRLITVLELVTSGSCRRDGRRVAGCFLVHSIGDRPQRAPESPLRCFFRVRIEQDGAMVI